MNVPVGSGSLRHSPMYRLLSEEFYRRIVEGRWPRGRILKNDALIAEEFGVSVPTVRRAFDILEQLHLIERMKGHRKIVSSDPRKRSAALMNFVDADGCPVSGTIRINALDRLNYGAAPDAARLGPVEGIFRISRSRAYRGRVFAVETAYVEAQADIPSFEDLQASSEHGVFAGRIAVRKEEYASVADASAIAIDTFGLQPSTQVLQVRRTLLGFDDMPLEESIAECVLTPDLRYRAR